MISLLLSCLLFLFAIPGSNISVSARHVIPRGTNDPLDFYMGFSQSSNAWFPKMGAMNDLMVGDKDGDGNRKPRRNCIFYVNQRPPMTDSDANWAKKRALQLAELMNLAQAGGDYHTLYDVWNLDDAFHPTNPGPMRQANEADLTRPWFQTTSEAYARLCEGTAYLVVEDGDIWDGSIWTTHERPALWDMGAVTNVVEVRPADIGAAYDSHGRIAPHQIPHHPYRGGQPPGNNLPRDFNLPLVPRDVDVDYGNNPTQRALNAIGNPDVGADPGAPPESICPGFNFGIINLGEDVGTGTTGYAVVDAGCKQVSGAITKNVCTEPLFSCSPAPIKITELHLNGQNYRCRSDSRAGRCPDVNTNVEVCCRNDGN